MSETTGITARDLLPKATLGVVADVIVPNLAKGLIIRRPKMVALAERFDLDRRAVRRFQQLQDKYGTGLLLLRIPVRSQALILCSAHVHRVLDGSPEPFGIIRSLASWGATICPTTAFLLTLAELRTSTQWPSPYVQRGD